MSNPIDGTWIVDECNTPNGKVLQISHLWDETGEEETPEGEVHSFPVQTHTDEIAQVCMDYHDKAVPLAHARLLAAAPDLLKACKDAVTELCEFIEDCIEDSEEFDYRVVRILEAAIAKAEKGEISPAEEGATA